MIFSSSTSRLALHESARIEARRDARAGDVVVAEVLTEHATYRHLECTDGSMAELHVGDRIVGTLGSRQALRGFVGSAPTELTEGETLSLLNMGGVIGRFIDSTSSLGAPATVRYIGTIVDEAGVVSLGRAAKPVRHAAAGSRPVILAIGTCMHVGKTTTMAKLIEAATAAGFSVGAAKLAGVAALKDLTEFTNAGAVDVKSFLDCGLPSTVDAEDLAPVFETVVDALAGDLVIVELGDGIVGHYHVETVLRNAAAMSDVAAVVLCAGDIVGAYGAKHCLDAMGIGITAISGLATENVAGTAVIESWLGVPAVNGVKNPDQLFAIVREALDAWTAGRTALAVADGESA